MFFPHTQIIIQALFLVCLSDFSRADVHLDDWDYDHHHTNPEDWKGKCKTGKRQSPINIDTQRTIKKIWGQPFVFNGYDQKISVLVKNNRHTIVVTPIEMEKQEIAITGGGLGESRFKFAQAHFHWGSTNDQGSEHTINNKSSAMEMHLVHWNHDVGKTVKEATEKDVYNSLEVLGVQFKIGLKNTKLEYLFNTARNVFKENTNATLEKNITLKDFLPKDKLRFYRYKGSLTTPPCNEIVIWTIFKEPIEVSQEQIDGMRRAYYRVKGEKKHRDISNNYRRSQPLYVRQVEEVTTPVYFNSPKTQKGEDNAKKETGLEAGTPLTHNTGLTLKGLSVKDYLVAVIFYINRFMAV